MIRLGQPKFPSRLIAQKPKGICVDTDRNNAFSYLGNEKLYCFFSTQITRANFPNFHLV